MKNLILTASLAVVLTACGGSGNQASLSDTENPFFTEFKTPYGVPPFDQIKMEHYKPAFLKAMALHNAEVKKIIENKEKANFENTILALDQAGHMLNQVASVFYSQSSCDTNDDIDALSRELSPLFSKHDDNISLNPQLFARVKKVFDERESLNLNKEQAKLLENTYKSFVRSGANLPADKQAELKELNAKISMLQLTFEQNVLKETNAFKMFVTDKKDLAGLPESSIVAAASAAKAAGKEGQWLFTLHRPSCNPFLQYASNRDLRKKMFEGYINRGNNNNATDNKAVVRDLVSARLAKAKLMGYPDYASYVLEERMAKNETNVYNLLDKVWTPALKRANDELADIQAEIKKEGKNFKAEGWDWRYYFDRAKKAKFNFDENEVRPYLQLENVRDGAFLLANKLYGITFTQVKNLPLPHPDAQSFICRDKDGSDLGVLYMDFFTRPSKSGGAWCGTYSSQSYKDGKKVNPVVTIVTNFTPALEGHPTLLTIDQAQTIFHEFGHSLHNLFHNVHYHGVSGVARDFVELPSQIMEHWVLEPDMLKEFAKNYKTGKIIPTSLIKKIENCGKYGQGFATVEYVAASYLDMDLHTLKEIPTDFDVMAFEHKKLNEERGLPEQIPSRYRSTYFSHTMGGGYTAGYYSYLWAEVLDCDAFQAYKETGNLFNQEVAQKFRNYVLAPGSIDDEMDMYKNFRGREPKIDALLENRGLK